MDAATTATSDTKQCYQCKRWLRPTSFYKAKYKRKHVDYNDGLLMTFGRCTERQYAYMDRKRLNALASVKEDQQWCRRRKKLEPLESFDHNPKSGHGVESLYHTCRKALIYERNMRAKAAARRKKIKQVAIVGTKLTDSRSSDEGPTHQTGHVKWSLDRRSDARELRFDAPRTSRSSERSSSGLDYLSRSSSREASEKLEDCPHPITQASRAIQAIVSGYVQQDPHYPDGWNNGVPPNNDEDMSLQKAYDIQTTTFQPDISAADLEELMSALEPLPVESASLVVQRLIHSILRQHDEAARSASSQMMPHKATCGEDVPKQNSWDCAQGGRATHDTQSASPEIEESIALALSIDESQIDPRLLSQQCFRPLSLL